MTSQEDPLDDLIVDESRVHRGLLRDLLSEYVQIGDKTGQLIFQEPFYEALKSKEKILIMLLSQLAKHEKGLADSSYLSPKEISDTGDIKKGTVDPAVRDLNEDGIIQSESGEYSIARPKLTRVASYLREDQD